MRKIGDELAGFFESFGIKDEKNYLGFIGAWRTLIGQDLSYHSRPTDIRGSVLFIAVDHPGWMTRIRFEEQKMLKKIRQSFPQLGITALGFLLVEKLPKSAHIITNTDENANEKPFLDISGDLAAQNNGDSAEMLVGKESASENTNNEFQQAMQNLKSAMARKSRNDR